MAGFVGAVGATAPAPHNPSGPSQVVGFVDDSVSTPSDARELTWGKLLIGTPDPLHLCFKVEPQWGKRNIRGQSQLGCALAHRPSTGLLWSRQRNASLTSKASTIKNVDLVFKGLKILTKQVQGS